ncbi:MAG: helix-turn-helix domain-containing protein [Solirubrobacterales bacterium]
MGRHRTDYQTFGATTRQAFDSRNRPVELVPGALRQTDYTKLIGRRIRRLREDLELKQGEVAMRARKVDGTGYSAGLVSRMERGLANPPLNAYIDVAEVLEVTPGVLLGERDLETPATEAELTVVRFLRRTGMSPDEALARIAGYGAGGVS